MKRLHLQISGRVQGVGYRYFTKEEATKAGVSGWVMNLPDGKVEAEIQGEENTLLEFISILRKGPPLGFVRDIVKYDVDVEEGEELFLVRY